MKNSKGGGIAGLFLLISLALIIGPFFVEAMGGVARLITLVFGFVFLILSVIIYVLAKLYKKTETDAAFVRTGMGGKKVVIDGGIIFVPFMHKMQVVSCATMKLIVKRENNEALITKDSLRADVISEFYIKVSKANDDVVTAATTLGDKAMSSNSIKELVEEKLISALRTAAADQTLNDLHSNRDEFAGKVQTIVAEDLKHNGLTLESVTISNLDQTNMETLNADGNVFDAQGAETVAKIVSTAKINRNKSVRDAEKEVKKQDVETAKEVFAQETDEAKALEARNLEIANAESQRASSAAKFKSEQDQASETAEVKKEEAVEKAKVEKEKSITLANIDKAKEEETASVDKKITVLKKEQEQAKADTDKAQEEEKAVTAQEKVITAKETEAAERKKKVDVIAETGVAEKEKVKKNMAVDVQAYETKELAGANKAAAKDKAEAITVEAEADKNAKVLEAQGDEAVQMVPVTVEQKRVEVFARETEIKISSKEISVVLETNLAQINAGKEVGIAQATALGEAISKANMTIWGDPKALEQLTSSFYKGQEKGMFLDGMQQSLPQNGSVDFITMMKNYVTGQSQSMFVEGWKDNLDEDTMKMVEGMIKSPGGALMSMGALLKPFFGRDLEDGEMDRVKEIIEGLKNAFSGKTNTTSKA